HECAQPRRDTPRDTPARRPPASGREGQRRWRQVVPADHQRGQKDAVQRVPGEPAGNRPHLLRFTAVPGDQDNRRDIEQVAVHRCSCGYPPPSQGEEPCAKSRKRLLWRLITVIPSTARPNGFGRESTAMTPRLFRPRAGVGRRPSPETVAVRLLEGGEPVV